MSLPPATIMSVPIHEYAEANEELANKGTANYYSCCGKSICGGCVHSFRESGNDEKCPFCKADRNGITDEEIVEEMMKRVEANDAVSICKVANDYYHGAIGLLQDQAKAIKLWKQAVKLGSSKSHFHLGIMYHEGGDLKKSKFHYEAAAMAGKEVARFNLGCMESQSGNMERAVKHWAIAASAGNYSAMHNLLIALEDCDVSRESVDSTLAEYNASCAEMRSEARDAFIQLSIVRNGAS